MIRPFTLLMAVGLLAGCHTAPETPAATTAAAPTVASSSATPTPPTDSLAAVRPFVPAGYQVLATARGNLNRDTYPDQLVALDTLLPDSLRRQSEARRPLLVLLGQPDGAYRLAARNDAVVLCSGCGGLMGDPFQQFVVKNGYFSVEHYGGSAWRWTHILTFRYNPTDQHWYLHRVGGESFHSLEPEKVKTYTKTVRDFGRVRFESYNDNLNLSWDESG